MIKRLLLPLTYAVPFIAFAQGKDVFDILELISDFLNQLVPFFIALAVIYFIYGVVKYIMSQDDEASKKASRQIMINGVIALFVIVSVWGIVNVLVSTFGLDVTPPPGPDVPEFGN